MLNVQPFVFLSSNALVSMSRFPRLYKYYLVSRSTSGTYSVRIPEVQHFTELDCGLDRRFVSRLMVDEYTLTSSTCFS